MDMSYHNTRKVLVASDRFDTLAERWEKEPTEQNWEALVKHCDKHGIEWREVPE